MRPPEGAKVLILLLGSIGDVIRALPIATSIKSSRPDIKLFWAVETKSLPIVEQLRNLDGVLPFYREKGVSEFLRFLAEVRRQKFDIVLDMQRHLKSGIVSLSSGAKRRVGFHRKNAKEGNWLFSNEQIPYFDPKRSKLENYLEFLKPLSVPTLLPLNFGIDAKPTPGMPSKYLVFVLGSSWKTKNWFQSGYENLLKIVLGETKLSVVLIGDRSTASEAEALTRLDSSGRIISLAGKTGLGDLSGILKGAVTAVGPDSGPGHLSAAVGTPYVTLFGPTDPTRVVPHGCEDLVVQGKLGCMPCWRKECPGLGRLCMRLITAEDVWRKLKRVTEMGLNRVENRR